jgi:hypothetical protein
MPGTERDVVFSQLAVTGLTKIYEKFHKHKQRQEHTAKTCRSLNTNRERKSVLFWNNEPGGKMVWYPREMKRTNVSGVYPSSAGGGLGQDYREEE